MESTDGLPGWKSWTLVVQSLFLLERNLGTCPSMFLEIPLTDQPFPEDAPRDSIHKSPSFDELSEEIFETGSRLLTLSPLFERWEGRTFSVPSWEDRLDSRINPYYWPKNTVGFLYLY